MDDCNCPHADSSKKDKKYRFWLIDCSQANQNTLILITHSMSKSFGFNCTEIRFWNDDAEDDADYL